MSDAKPIVLKSKDSRRDKMLSFDYTLDVLFPTRTDKIRQEQKKVMRPTMSRNKLVAIAATYALLIFSSVLNAVELKLLQ